GNLSTRLQAPDTHPTICKDHLACGIGYFAVRECGNNSTDVLRSAPSFFYCQLLADKFVILLLYPRSHIRINNSRSYFIDGYVVFSKPRGQQLCHHGKPCLRYAIFAPVYGRYFGRNRGDGNYTTFELWIRRFGCHHSSRNILRQKERAFQIGINDKIVSLFVHFEHIHPFLRRDAGIVDQHIYGTERLNSVFYDFFPVGGAADVSPAVYHLPTKSTKLPDLAGRLLLFPYTVDSQ